MDTINSMKRVVISQHVLSLDGRKRDSLEHNYIQYFSQFIPALIPVSNVLKDVKGFLDTAQPEGIILSGGNDVDPKLYNGVAVEKNTYAPERDETERKILEYAVDNKIPVFTECRGTQFLNVFFGGSLKTVSHVMDSHSISMLLDPTKNRSETSSPKEIEVNSYHTYGFTEKEQSKDLKSFAACSDGVIEGVVHPTLPIVGIMWHPERSSPNIEYNRSLIRSFVSKSGFWAV